MRIGFLCLYGMGGRMDSGCVGLTVYGGDLPSAAADSAKAPIASTQGGVGESSPAATARAIASFDLGNRPGTIEHSYDHSRPKRQPRRKRTEASAELAALDHVPDEPTSRQRKDSIPMRIS